MPQSKPTPPSKPTSSSPQPPAVGVPERRVSVQVSQWIGPLPAPQDLAAYQTVDKDAPRMILEEFQKQGAHSRWLAKVGTILDFLLALMPVVILFLFFVAAVYFFVKGNNWAGSAFMAPPVIVAIAKSLNVRKQAE